MFISCFCMKMYMFWVLIEQAHDKTYNKINVISKDSIYPPGMAKSFVYPSLDSLEIVEGTWG